MLKDINLAFLDSILKICNVIYHRKTLRLLEMLQTHRIKAPFKKYVTTEGGRVGGQL